MTQRFFILGNHMQAGTNPSLQFINLSQMTQKTQKKNIRDIREFCEKLFLSPMVYRHLVLSPAGYLSSKLIPSSLNGFIQVSDEKYFQKIND